MSNNNVSNFTDRDILERLSYRTVEVMNKVQQHFDSEILATDLQLAIMDSLEEAGISFPIGENDPVGIAGWETTKAIQSHQSYFDDLLTERAKKLVGKHFRINYYLLDEWKPITGTIVDEFYKVMMVSDIIIADIEQFRKLVQLPLDEVRTSAIAETIEWLKNDTLLDRNNQPFYKYTTELYSLHYYKLVKRSTNDRYPYPDLITSRQEAIELYNEKYRCNAPMRNVWKVNEEGEKEILPCPNRVEKEGDRCRFHGGLYSSYSDSDAITTAVNRASSFSGQGKYDTLKALLLAMKIPLSPQHLKAIDDIDDGRTVQVWDRINNVEKVLIGRYKLNRQNDPGITTGDLLQDISVFIATYGSKVMNEGIKQAMADEMYMYLKRRQWNEELIVQAVNEAMVMFDGPDAKKSKLEE